MAKFEKEREEAQTFRIKELGIEERPREKFLAKGGDALSNAELIALIIRSGTKSDNAVELSRKVLHSAGNSLDALRRFSIDDYKNIKGIGEGKALGIMAALELGRRNEPESGKKRISIYGSEDAAKAISPVLRDLRHEECWVLYLNRNHTLIGKERISKGGISATVVDLRIIIKQAMAKLATGIILAHNHPSGNCSAGEQDKIQTMRLKKAAEFCEIELLDHIIIAGNKYFSFLDEGLM